MRREGDGCAEGEIYSVPEEGVLLFFGHGIVVVEGCLLPWIGKTNYLGSILGSKAGRNEGVHWVKRAVYIGSKKNPMLGLQKDPTVGRLTDLL